VTLKYLNLNKLEHLNDLGSAIACKSILNKGLGWFSFAHSPLILTKNGHPRLLPQYKAYQLTLARHRPGRDHTLLTVGNFFVSA